MVNRGELPMYFVENSHEAIISKEVFDKVQRELESRAQKYVSSKPTEQPYLFTSLIRCGLCGGHFFRKLTASGKKYKKKATWIREELLQNVSEILVPEHNYLVYVFHDGRMEGIHWQNPSRRESWTPEMKQKVRENTLRRLA